MSYTRSEMVFTDYNWTAYPSDDPHVTGVPDSTLFNRHEGYEMLYLINKFLDSTGRQSTANGQRAERMLRNDLPGHLRSQEHVMNWLKSNW